MLYERQRRQAANIGQHQLPMLFVFRKVVKPMVLATLVSVVFVVVSAFENVTKTIDFTPFAKKQWFYIIYKSNVAKTIRLSNLIFGNVKSQLF